MLFYYVVIPLFVSIVTCTIFIFLWRNRIIKDLEIRHLIKHLEKEISELIVELNGATERNLVLLENKLGILKEVLDKAGKMQKILTMEYEKFESTEKYYANAIKSHPLRIENESVYNPHGTEDEKTPLNATLTEKDKILILFRKGESIPSIAEELGMSRGKVELVLSLHDR